MYSFAFTAICHVLSGMFNIMKQFYQLRTYFIWIFPMGIQKNAGSAILKRYRWILFTGHLKCIHIFSLPKQIKRSYQNNIDIIHFVKITFTGF